MTNTVSPRIAAEYLVPVSEAATVAFREVVGLEVGVESITSIVVPAKGDGRIAWIEQTFPRVTGWIGISLSDAAATEIARRMVPDARLDPVLIDDCLGELTNVLAGQAKTLLAQTPWHFTIGTPMAGPAEPGVRPGPWLAIHLISEIGSMVVLCRDVESEIG